MMLLIRTLLLQTLYTILVIGLSNEDQLINNFENFQEKISNASFDLLKNETWLAHELGSVGLYSEGARSSPINKNWHIYGDDVKYMLKFNNEGLWQIPRQLAAYLIQLVSYGKITSFLEVGTCRGATITVITIYLMRYGLVLTDTLDVNRHLHPSVHHAWKKMKLPIRYKLSHTGKFNLSLPHYDAVFIDGHHSYEYVLSDVKYYSPKCKLIALHDINDYHCVDVRKLWNELKSSQQQCGIDRFHEFTYHSHNDSMMGIGLFQMPPKVPLQCPYFNNSSI